MMREKSLAYYQAAVDDLVQAKRFLESVHSHFPSYRVPLKPLNEAIKKAKEALARKDKKVWGDK